MTGSPPAHTTASRLARLALAASLLVLTALAPARTATAQKRAPALPSPQAVPTLTVPDTGGTFTKGGPAVVVSASLLVTGSDTITGALVLITTNFASGDRLGIAGQSGTSGTISGLTWSYNSSTGVLTFSGAASAATFQAALRQVTFQNANAGAPSLPRTVRFSLGGSLPNPGNGHYYEFVTAPEIDWTVAKAAAAGRGFFGLQGYLTTITSASENTFVASKLAGEGWMGASDDPGEGASEGQWRWATGPEAGQLFYSDITGPVGGAYNNWADGEPNNADGENFAHFLANGQWNDYSNGNDNVVGYVVEYGGLPGDPTLQITDDTTVSFALAAPTLSSLPPIAGANASAYPVSGTCLAGASVTVTVGGVSKTVTCAGNGTFSTTLNVSGIADAGSVPVTVSQTDGTITGGPSSATTLKDTVAAPLTVTTPPAITNANKVAYPVSGTCEPNAAVTVTVGGVSATATCAATGTYSTTVDLSNVPDGANVPISVMQTDALGNTGGPASGSAPKDTQAPPVMIGTGTEVRTGTPVITGTTEPGALVTVVIDLDNNPATTNDRVTYQVTAAQDGSWALNLATATPISGSLPLGGLVPGRTAGITATARDAFGNTGAPDSQALFVRPLIYLPIAASGPPEV
jgi:hypothetical protein